MSDNITSALIGGLIGLVGAFVGAWFANQLSIKAQKRQTEERLTFDLYAEFQSELMLKSRIEACKVFEENIADLPLGFKHLRQKIGNEDLWFHVSKVIHFFERYAVYYNTNLIDKSLSKSTLDRYFIHWYKKYLKELVKNSLEQDYDEWGGWAEPIRDLGEELKA